MKLPRALYCLLAALSAHAGCVLGDFPAVTAASVTGTGTGGGAGSGSAGGHAQGSGGAGQGGDAGEPPVVTQIALGGFHSCARKSDGSVYCWGANNWAQLGDGFAGDAVLTPMRVKGLVPVADIAAGQGHTCARTGGGDVYCWGGNSSGQVGDGLTGETSQPVPTHVAGLPAVAQIAAGSLHTCAVTSTAEVYCWGEGASGRLGDGGTAQRPTPRKISTFTDVAQIALGDDHSCARKNGGAAFCWGADDHGQLGDGDANLADKLTPVPVMNLTGALAIATGSFDSCAIEGAQGAAFCWGEGALGKLGDGAANNPDAKTPMFVTGLNALTQLAPGRASTCALNNSGAVYCWGYNGDGELGRGPTSPMEIDTATVPTLTGVLEVAAGWFHMCVRRTTGDVWCWGQNDNGQVGNGSKGVDALAPSMVMW